MLTEQELDATQALRARMTEVKRYFIRRKAPALTFLTEVFPKYKEKKMRSKAHQVLSMRLSLNDTEVVNDWEQLVENLRNS